MTRTGRVPLLLLLLLLATPLQLCACGVHCDVPRCDIRSRDCQEQARDATVCIRGGARPEVDIQVVEAAEYLESRLDELDTWSDEDVSDTRAFYRGLALFGLLPKGTEPSDAVERDVDRTGAFYDFETRQVTVLARGEGDGAVTTLVHELVHAMQDAEHDLASLEAPSIDAQQGLAAMIEGEASLYDSYASAYQTGFELDEVRWPTYFDQTCRHSEQHAVDVDDAFFALRSAFVYPFGRAYAYQVLKAGGRDAVAALPASPPVSARQVMLGYGAVPPGGEPWLDAELADLAVPRLPDDFVHVHTTGLGAFGLRVLARRGDPDVRTSFVDLLRGDALSVFVTKDDDTIVTVYRMVFANEEAASAAERAIPGSIRRAPEVVRLERTVTVLAHDGAWEVPALDGLTWGPVPKDEDESTGDVSSSRSTRIACAVR